jgi:hypothetical protein
MLFVDESSFELKAYLPLYVPDEIGSTVAFLPCDSTINNEKSPPNLNLNDNEPGYKSSVTASMRLIRARRLPSTFISSSRPDVLESGKDQTQGRAQPAGSVGPVIQSKPAPTSGQTTFPGGQGGSSVHDIWLLLQGILTLLSISSLISGTAVRVPRAIRRRIHLKSATLAYQLRAMALQTRRASKSGSMSVR